ncbi:hypothetical protein mRhiFer1_009682 [Rhinolophus ferrumequinum]|uniref:Uncharacterized protein n=1 Tax=Rhinolophus ferrumequinum TaxID=59479 RepID=A0A7J7R2G0_RHIFE|nr:hypothetical protein mRhiFer1_009682 [Rhinolophus ferrumequinum]
MMTSEMFCIIFLEQLVPSWLPPSFLSNEHCPSAQTQAQRHREVSRLRNVTSREGSDLNPGLSMFFPRSPSSSPAACGLYDPWQVAFGGRSFCVWTHRSRVIFLLMLKNQGLPGGNADVESVTLFWVTCEDVTYCRGWRGAWCLHPQ